MIKARLKLIQKTLGLTLKDFARKCEIPYPTMQSYMLGKRTPTIDNILKIVEAYSVNPTWLLLGRGKMFLSKASSGKNPQLEQVIEKLAELQGEELDMVVKVVKCLVEEK